MRQTTVAMDKICPHLPCPLLWLRMWPKSSGETQDVRKLNKYRNKLRNSPNSKVLQQDYKIHLAHEQAKVLGKHSQVAKSFNEWEKTIHNAKHLPLHRQFIPGHSS